MEKGEEIMNLLIRNRRLLVAGKGDVPDSSNGNKVTFHFKTVAIYDDALRNDKEPHEKDHDHTNSKSTSSSKCPVSGTTPTDTPTPNSSDKKDASGDSSGSCCGSTPTGRREITVDDSKSTGCKPMELFYGHQFKFALWEEWLKNMRIGERSSLVLDWSICQHVYPLLSKSYRNFCNPPDRVYETEESRARRSNHCCAMQTKTSHGYKDLDCLVDHPPQMLEFTLELISVENPNKLDREVWLMNDNEMTSVLPDLKIEANRHFVEKQYEPASLKYRKALGILEQLQMREKPNDTEWKELEKQKIPFLSNLAQCELFLGQFYEALEHSDEAVRKDPTNVKALFRRAKANLAVWNIDAAKTDFAAVLALDATLGNLVKAQLEELEKRVKEKNTQDGQRLKGKLFG